MSVFRCTSPDSLKDYHEVRDYILNLNKSVQNVFNSLDPDDNFTEEELNRYNENESSVAMAELNSKNLKILFSNKKEKTGAEILAMKERVALKVRKNELVNELNLEKDDIRISGNRLEIVTDNFIVTNNRMYARGAITATGGTFGGWTITNGAWNGNSNSRINVNSINADSGSVATVRAYGSVNLHATAMGNFDTIDFTDSTLSGGFTCSCMEEMGGDGATLSCRDFYAHTTYRDPGERYPTRPTPPDDSPTGNQSDAKRYNTNDSPIGGMLAESVSVRAGHSYLAGRTWSDRRLKEHIVPIKEEKAAALLTTLKPSTYSMNGDEDRLNGFIAQEVPDEFRVMKNGFYKLKYRSISATLDVEMKKYTLALNKALNEANYG